MGINYDLGGSDLIVNSVRVGASAPNQVSSAYTVTSAAGATKTLTRASNASQTVLLDTLAGSVVTLPAATGTGMMFRFVVSVLATSNSHKVQVANATDFMIGGVTFADTDGTAAVDSFMCVNSGTVATNSDTITLNRSTTGSVSVGEWFDVRDIAANTWLVTGLLSNTGTPTTPFSAAV